MYHLIKKIIVADSEKTLLYRDKQFQDVLEPGTYRFFDPANRLSLVQLPFEQGIVEHEQLDRLVSQPAFANKVVVHDMQENEVGVVYFRQKPIRILTPGERLVHWIEASELEVRQFDITANERLDDTLLSALVREGLDGRGLATRARAPVAHLLVPDQYIGLLYYHGRFKQVLNAGRYGYWNLEQQFSVTLHNLKLQTLEISGQEILTKDRVSLRINLTASYRLVDAVKAAEQLSDIGEYIYKRLQLALREVVGTRSLDEILVDKDGISEVIFRSTAEKLSSYGIQLDQVGVKDIILPGEMKEILNQVVQAQKAAEANLIQRREETAATRSLNNTAKMMENNPILLRLKELETLEKVTERIHQLNVYGGIESVMDGLIRLKN